MKKLPFFFLLFLTSLLQAQTRPTTDPNGWRPVKEPGCGGWMTSVEVSPFDSKHILVGGDLLSIGLSHDRGETWEPVFGLYAVEIGDSTFHPSAPQTVWVGTMSGPYKSVDGGKTWTEKRNGFPTISEYSYTAPIEKVLFDPNDENHLFAFGGSSRRWAGNTGSPLWGAVWESTDGGENWKMASKLEKNIVSATFVAGSSKVLFVAAPDLGIFRSADGGQNWEKASEGLPHGIVERVVAHPTDSNILWTSLNSCPQKNEDGSPAKCLPGGIFKTTDGGKSWFACNEGLRLHATQSTDLTARFKAFCVAPSNPDVLYTNDSAWNGATFYRSDDGGKSWRVILTDEMNGVKRPVKIAYPSGYGVTVLSVNPKNENEVYGAGAETIFASADGGKTWKDLTSEQVPDGTDWTWKGRGYSGLCCMAFRFDPYHEGRSVLMAMDAGKCWESNDFMKSWSYHGQKPQPWGGGNDACFAKDGTVYVTTGQGGNSGNVLKGGLNQPGPWEPLAVEGSGLPDGKTGVATGIFVSPGNSSRVWVVFGGKLYRTKDGGKKWELASDADSFGWIASVPGKEKTFYVSGKSGLWFTKNGKDFVRVGGPKVAGRICVDARGRVLHTPFHADWKTREGGLWRYDASQPEESRWVKLYDDPTHACAVCPAVHPKKPETILLISADHPFHDHIWCEPVRVSTDDGKTWRSLSDGLPTLRAECATFNPFDPDEIVVGTGGCGFFIRKGL